MYKAIIIDDEMIIRQGIRAIVDWEYYGFEVIGEADNGIEGLKIVLEYNPDLILIDIKMPGIDGIELLKRLRKKGFKGKVVILTGHSEFQYAKQAIELGVEAYLLKPIEEGEFCGIFDKIKEQLDNDMLYKEMVSYHQENRNVELCEKLIFMREMDEEIVQEINKNAFLNEEDTYYVVLMRRQEKLIDEKNTSQYLFINCQEYSVLIYRNKKIKYLKLALTNLLQKYMFLDDNCFITVGGQARGYSKIKESFNDAKRLFERSFLFRKDQIVFWEQYIQECNKKISNSIDVEYIYDLIEVGNDKAMYVYMELLEEGIITSTLSVEKIKSICINVIIEVNLKFIYNYKIDKRVLPNNQEVMETICECKQLSEVIDYMKRVFTNISDYICDGSKDNTMKRILNYVHNNYHKNLKLEGLARLFNYNSCYLGKIFKDNTGISFSNYLDEIRIEHAKEFLESGSYKVYEISERVGYKNVDYFYCKFKKIVEMSPKEYKKQYENQRNIS